MDAPKLVTLYLYKPSKKQGEGEYVAYPALVIGVRDFEDHDSPLLNLVYFRSDDVASHHALNGIDWADTLTRMLDVPHEDDQDKQSFYWRDEDEDHADVLSDLHNTIEQNMDDEIARLNKLVDDDTTEIARLHDARAATTEGKDAELQKAADQGARQITPVGDSRTVENPPSLGSALPPTEPDVTTQLDQSGPPASESAAASEPAAGSSAGSAAKD